MKKTIVPVCIILILAAMLCACAPAVSFQTSGGQYDVVKIASAQTALEHTAADGNTILTITLKFSNQNLDDAQNAFMPTDGTPCYVTDGSQQYPCKALFFQSNGTGDQVVLLFEVPANWPGEFSLGGTNFAAVALKK